MSLSQQHLLKFVSPILAALTVSCSDEELVAPDGAVICAREEIDLAVGEWRLLADRDAVCLHFDAEQAEYALAYFDTRLVEQAQTGREEVRPTGSFGVSLVDGTVPVSAKMVNFSEAGSTVPAVQSCPSSAEYSLFPCDGASETEILCRSEPWTVGEQFPLVSEVEWLGYQDSLMVQVVGEYGHLVFVALLAEVEAFESSIGAQTLADSMGTVMVSRAIPLLSEVLTSTLPVTSVGSGQLLVVLNGPDSPRAKSVQGNERAHLIIETNLRFTDEPTSGAVGLLAHELTHAFQIQYTWEIGASEWTVWSIEGGADLATSEILRYEAGVAFDANLDVIATIAQGDGEPAADYVASLGGAGGEIASGYRHSASLLRDLMYRRILAGDSETEALGQVLKGALEGWYGSEGSSAEPDGLTARMRRLLGDSWDPVSAVLTWTLSNALDDQISSNRFHTPALFESWNSEHDASWPPHATYDMATPVPISLDNRAIGSTGYFYVTNPGVSGILIAKGHAARSVGGGTPDPREGVRWMIVRSN